MAEGAPYREVQINTGKSHGAFYLPRPEWVDVTIQWMRNDSGE